MPRDIKHTNISEKNVTEIQSQIRMFESVFMPLLRTRLNDKLMVYESQIVTLDHKVSDQPIRPSIYIYIYIYSYLSPMRPDSPRDFGAI